MHPVLNAALPVFALIFTGFLCGRLGVLLPNATASLNRFTIAKLYGLRPGVTSGAILVSGVVSVPTVPVLVTYLR